MGSKWRYSSIHAVVLAEGGTYTRTTARALAKDLNLFYDKVRRMRAQNLATESKDAAHG